MKSEPDYARGNEAKGCQLYSYLLMSKMKSFKSIKKGKVTQQTQK